MKVWFQENLRMVISIVIVVVIAGGIYAYSKRTQAPTVSQEAAVSDQGEGKISVIGEGNQKAEEGNAPAESAQAPTAESAAPQKSETAAPQTEMSKETETSFAETAVKGDGSTKLARRALANYLEKNPDSSLNAAQKIYIEDSLRRQVKDGRLKIGDERTFSKDAIAKAIEKSKGLNEKQIKNLQKFAQRVSGLN